MALLYVDPAGSNTSPYDTWAKAATQLNTALAAAGDGDTVILRKRGDHVFTGWPVNITANITVVNEHYDNNYNECKVNFAANSGIQFQGTNKTTTMRGIRFQGGRLTTGTPKGIFTFGGGISGQTVNLYACRITDWVGTFTSGQGGLFTMNSTSAVSTINFYGVEIDNTWRETSSHPLYNGFIANADVTWEDCWLHDLGREAGEHLGQIQITSTLRDITVNIRRLRAERCYGGTALGDGGSLYIYADPGRVTTSTVEYSQFLDSKAAKGGGFWVGQNADCTTRGCLFYRCVATTYGGGATGRGGNTDHAGLGESHIYGNKFIECHSYNYGGALRNTNNNGRMYVRNNTFVDCTAYLEGQAIWTQPFTSTLTTEKPDIYNNVFVGTTGKPQVVAGAAGDINAISNCLVEGGSAGVMDTGATISNIEPITRAEVQDDGTPRTSLARRAGAYYNALDTDFEGRRFTNPPDIGPYRIGGGKGG